MQFRRASRPDVSINIAPLVDVVFILVLFYAISTTFLETAGLELDLPRSSSTAPQQSEELAVLLSASGSVTFQGRQLERDALAEPLAAALSEREDKRVVLRADAGSRHGDVVALMDVIRTAGAASLTVAARPVEP